MLLFQRDKSIKVNQIDDNTIEVTAHMKDRFHEIRTSLSIESQSKTIVNAQAEMITVPFDLCQEVCAKMSALNGLEIKKGIKRKVQQIIGGTRGCIHLADMIMDSLSATVQAADFCLLPSEMPLEEKIQKIQAINMGICHTYSNLDRNPRYTGNREV